jgi:hypothetical protein
VAEFRYQFMALCRYPLPEHDDPRINSHFFGNSFTNSLIYGDLFHKSSPQA